MMDNVLMVVPLKYGLARGIYDKMMARLFSIERSNKANVSLFVDTRFCPVPVEKKTPWSKVAVIRNQILDDGLWKSYSHLLWIDADVVEMPDDLVDSLLATESNGIAAPLVLVEGTRRFYDWAAFIHKDKSHVEPTNRWRIAGRNICPEYPYYPEFKSDNPISNWDCVGTLMLVNTDIYREGARYEDHPAFTDHWPICHKALQMGRRVVMNRDIVVCHANLPMYGEMWH